MSNSTRQALLQLSAYYTRLGRHVAAQAVFCKAVGR